MIYLDYAATSYKKPKSVYKAVYNAMIYNSANPGRGGHSYSARAGEIIYETREKLATLFHISSPEQFILFPNTTYALNAGIKGVLKRGDHVVISSMEHNSVMRPLAELKRKGIITYTVVQGNEKGVLSLKDFEKAILPNTKLVICTHASNVCGNQYDIVSLSSLVKHKGALFMADIAQSAGFTDIDLSLVDMAAFPGHKGLYGPLGSGGLYIRNGLSLETIIEGGTGSQSELLYQPEELPDRFESGTQNVPAIAGLGAGVDFILSEGIETIAEKKRAFIHYAKNELLNIPGITVYGDDSPSSILSFNIKDMDSVFISDLLDTTFHIATRGGLHCAPMAHKTLQTLESGTVRMSVGYFTTKNDINLFLSAIQKIVHKQV